MNNGSVSSHEKYSTIWGDFYTKGELSKCTVKTSSRIVFQRLILPRESSDDAFTHSETGQEKYKIQLNYNLPSCPENFRLFKYDLDKE